MKQHWVEVAESGIQEIDSGWNRENSNTLVPIRVHRWERLKEKLRFTTVILKDNWFIDDFSLCSVESYVTHAVFWK